MCVIFPAWNTGLSPSTVPAGSACPRRRMNMAKDPIHSGLGLRSK